jgi:hypothetical protein
MAITVIEMVVKQFEKKHKDVIFLPMNKLFFKIIEEDEILSKYCFKSFWRISQRIESEILLNVLNYCVENDLLAFGIHDAVIVPSHSAEQVKEFMENELVKQVKLWKEKKQASEEAIKVYIENENTFFNKDKNLSFVDNFKIDVFDSSTEIKTFGNIKLPAYDFIYRTYLYNKIQKTYASMNS